MTLPEDAVLLLIDLQKAIDDPSWGVRNNPSAEQNAARLLERFRNERRPVIHVRHDSLEPNSTYRPGQPGNEFKEITAPREGETVVSKNTNSAFIGTNLEERLHTRRTLVVCGVITNNSVEATVRMAGNLGYITYLVEDACFTFGRRDWHGRERTADEVHAMSLANLHGEYCTVVRTSDVLGH